MEGTAAAAAKKTPMSAAITGLMIVGHRTAEDEFVMCSPS
jgi:hypothetical protein